MARRIILYQNSLSEDDFPHPDDHTKEITDTAGFKPFTMTKVLLTFSLPCFSVQIKHKICKNLNSVQQQHEHHHEKVLIESFRLTGHTL